MFNVQSYPYSSILTFIKKHLMLKSIRLIGLGLGLHYLTFLHVYFITRNLAKSLQQLPRVAKRMQILIYSKGTMSSA